MAPSLLFAREMKYKFISQFPLESEHFDDEFHACATIALKIMLAPAVQ